MKIIPLSRNTIGKLVYFDKPIFRINKVLDYSDKFTEKLEESTSLKFSDPIIEPIDPGTVLSKEHETLKYNYVGFKEIKNDLFDKVIMGFGEKGYYYDIYFNFKNEQNNLKKNEIQPIIEDFDLELKKIETLLHDFYVIEPNKAQKNEISNFVMNIKFKKPIETLIQPEIANKIMALANVSEPIINQIENKVTFNFTLNFYPKVIREGLLINPNDIVVPNRQVMFSRRIA